MYEISIKAITKDNWKDAFAIAVHDSQKAFVPTVAESLAFAYLTPWDEALDPYALYEKASLIGAFYLSYTPNSEANYWLGGFQIDQMFQGKGYGKQALYEIIEFVRETHPTCKVLSLTVEKKNQQAIRLYEKVGFISQDRENQYGERIYKLVVR